MSGVGLQTASFVLLVITAFLSFQTHVFQYRTSIRESLEQLDDVEVTNTVKVRAILNKFDYWGLSIQKLLYGKTTLLVKFHSMERVPEAASDPSCTMFHWLQDDEVEEFLEELEQSISGISDVKSGDGEFEITIYSRNSVEIRRIASQVTVKIRENRVET